jgi:hypothetical protein
MPPEPGHINGHHDPLLQPELPQHKHCQGKDQQDESSDDYHLITRSYRLSPT